MKKLNLIVIGLGLFLLQSLYGQNPLVDARKAVEQVETSLESDRSDAVAKAQAAIDKIPSKDRAQKLRLQQRLNQASSRAYYGPATAPAGATPTMAPTPTRAMSALDFDQALTSLESDVRQLRTNYESWLRART